MQKKKFKLIKEFPYQIPLGTIVTLSDSGLTGICYESESIEGTKRRFSCINVENYPEFWEEIIQEEETHRFHIDEPCRIWRRYWYDISGTYEYAVKYMKKEVINMDLDDLYFNESEYVGDTEDYTGEPRELFNEQGEQL